jgi:hypothetical protein
VPALVPASGIDLGGTRSGPIGRTEGGLVLGAPEIAYWEARRVVAGWDANVAAGGGNRRQRPSRIQPKAATCGIIMIHGRAQSRCCAVLEGYTTDGGWG